MPAAKKRLPAIADAAESPPNCVRVEVTNETDVEVDPARIAAAVQMVLADADCTVANISIAIVDDPTIHRLNRQFLEHDYPTDVLSFVLDEPPRLAGEIIASIDTARREAADVGWDAADELLLYAVHGALHLVGHLDKQPAESAAMRSAERRVLEQLGVRVAPADPRWREIDAMDPRGQEANAP